MSKLINADELEPDTEWSDYYDGFTSYSQSQIDDAEEVKAIPLEKVKQAREEIKEYVNRASDCKQKVAFKACLMLLDNLIEGVEDESKESE